MGGAQYQAKVLLERMIKRHEFEVHYLARKMSDNLNPTEYGLHRIGESTGMYFLTDGPRLLRKLKELKPDAIYVHVASAYLGVAAWYARGHGARLIWHLASDIDVKPWNLREQRNPLISYLDKKLVEYGLRNAHAIVAQTEDQSSLLEKHYGISPTCIIPNFHPEPQEQLKPALPPTIVWVANLKAVKQPEKFVALAARLTDLNVRCTMYGAMQLRGDRAANFKRQLDQIENLNWAGPVSQEEVNAVLSTATLLVNTSSYEGFSNTFIQAWQRRVPVCSLVVDPDRLLSAAALGGVANDSLDELEALIRRYLQDEDLRLNTGSRAQSYAQENHGMAAADRLISTIVGGSDN